MLITSALFYELAPFIRRLHKVSYPLEGNRYLLNGFLGSGTGSSEVQVLITGAGEKAAVESFLKALPALKINLLLISGTAGALTQIGQAGDLFISSNYGDAIFRDHLLKAIKSKVRRGKIWYKALHTAAEPVIGRDNKTRLNMASGAFAVDMESAALAATAKKSGFKTAVLRIFSDALEDELPVFNEKIFDQEGFPSFTGMARYLLGHPLTIPQLISFSRRSGADCRELADILEKIIPEIDPEIDIDKSSDRRD